jgi:hypothetical protein
VGGAVYWGGEDSKARRLCGRNDGGEEESCRARDRHRRAGRGKRSVDHGLGAVGADLEETMSVPRPLFGLATLPVSETKSALLLMIERAQLEILYRHPR